MGRICYNPAMAQDTISKHFRAGPPVDLDARPTKVDADEAHERVLEMAHTSAMEGNPMSPEHIALFEKFRRERWTNAQIEAHIDGLLRELAGPDV